VVERAVVSRQVCDQCGDAEAFAGVERCLYTDMTSSLGVPERTHEIDQPMQLVRFEGE